MHVFFGLQVREVPNGDNNQETRGWGMGQPTASCTCVAWRSASMAIQYRLELSSSNAWSLAPGAAAAPGMAPHFQSQRAHRCAVHHTRGSAARCSAMGRVGGQVNTCAALMGTAPTRTKALQHGSGHLPAYLEHAPVEGALSHVVAPVLQACKHKAVCQFSTCQCGQSTLLAAPHPVPTCRRLSVAERRL